MKAAAQVKLGTEGFKTLPSVLLCLLRRTNHEQNKEWLKTLPTTFTVDPERAASHFKIGHFALGAYAASAVRDDSLVLDVLGE